MTATMPSVRNPLPKPRRAYLVAREIGVPSRVLIEDLNALGIRVTSTSSNLEGVLAETAVHFFSEQAGQ